MRSIIFSTLFTTIALAQEVNVFKDKRCGQGVLNPLSNQVQLTGTGSVTGKLGNISYRGSRSQTFGSIEIPDEELRNYRVIVTDQQGYKGWPTPEKMLNTRRIDSKHICLSNGGLMKSILLIAQKQQTVEQVPVGNTCCRIYKQSGLKGENKEFCVNEGDFKLIIPNSTAGQYFLMDEEWDKQMSSWECGANLNYYFCNDMIDFTDKQPLAENDLCENFTSSGFGQQSNNQIDQDNMMSSLILVDTSNSYGSGVTLFSGAQCSGDSQTSIGQEWASEVNMDEKYYSGAPLAADMVKSIGVAPGLTVELWENNNFEGVKTQTFTGTDPYGENQCFEIALKKVSSLYWYFTEDQIYD